MAASTTCVELPIIPETEGVGGPIRAITRGGSMRRMRAGRGFTLLELMIALMVVGILAGIAIPAYFSLVSNTRAAQAVADLQAVRAAVYRALKEGASSTMSRGIYGAAARESETKAQ